MESGARFKTLDGLRGIASLFIVCFHILLGGGSVYSKSVTSLIGLGNIGTDIFFVISGFGVSVASYKIIHEERSLLTFIEIRLRKIYLTFFCSLFLAAIINGFLAPPLLVVIMLVANNRRIMGDRVNGRWSNILGLTTTVVMFAAAVALVLTWEL